MDDKGLKMSASLAYYSALSIGPLVLLVIYIAGAFFGQDAIKGKIFTDLNGLIGPSASLQIQSLIKNIALSGKTTFALIVGIVSLVFTASSLFGDMQDSINIIWRVKPKPKSGFKKYLLDRLKTSSMIVAISFLLIITLIFNGLVLAINEFLGQYITLQVFPLLEILNFIITAIVIGVMFAFIFKFLPDVRIKWKDVRIGAMFTTILFMIGRYIIGLYITSTNTGEAYETAGAVIVILVWVYYTAAILYIGAEFTQVYADYKGRELMPAEYAVHVEQITVENEVDVLPKQNDISPSEEKPSEKTT